VNPHLMYISCNIYLFIYYQQEGRFKLLSPQPPEPAQVGVSLER
jgi:hypothetical protein